MSGPPPPPAIAAGPVRLKCRAPRGISLARRHRFPVPSRTPTEIHARLLCAESEAHPEPFAGTTRSPGRPWRLPWSGRVRTLATTPCRFVASQDSRGHSYGSPGRCGEAVLLPRRRWRIDCRSRGRTPKYPSSWCPFDRLPRSLALLVTQYYTRQPRACTYSAAPAGLKRDGTRAASPLCSSGLRPLHTHPVSRVASLFFLL